MPTSSSSSSRSSNNSVDQSKASHQEQMFMQDQDANANNNININNASAEPMGVATSTTDSTADDNNPMMVENDNNDNDNDDDNTEDNANETEEEREKRLLKEENEWTYQPPPNNKRSFEFYEDANSTKTFCKFSSEFCSGNLHKVERTGKTSFALHLANDCMGGPHPVGNKMWFFFGVTGVPHGTTLSFSLQQLPFVKTYTYGYTPVVAVDPAPSSSVAQIESYLQKQQQQSSNDQNNNNTNKNPSSSSFANGVNLGSKNFVRISGPSVTVTPAPLPESVRLAREEKQKQQQLLQQQQQADSSPPTSTTTTSSKKKKKDNPNPEYCNVSFDYTFDAVLRNASSLSSSALAEKVNDIQFTYYFAFCHPYPYEKLQRHLSVWSSNYGPKAKPKVVTASTGVSSESGASGGGPSNSANRELAKQQSKQLHPVLYRELLTKTLDGNRVDMLTITARPTSTMREKESEHEEKEAGGGEPCFGPNNCLPLLDDTKSPPTLQSLLDENRNDEDDTTKTRTRPLVPNLSTTFPPHRKFVLLSARVHPGEVPASHVMHGVIEFLLNTEDPRAIALRENFIFVIVPMINPDGVARGHTRADPVGCNLNRMYKHPSPKKHPSVWALRQLMLHLATSERGLALYVDMHAHANKRGSFFYGNALDAKRQVENLLFPKLVSLNSPYLMFNDCNFTQSNMYSMGKTGVCRDGSSRVTAWLEMGLVNSYTLECNSMLGPTGGSNGVVSLNPSSTTSSNNNNNLVGKVPSVELEDRPQGAPSPRYTPSLVFHDIGRAMMVSLLDMVSMNPISRLPLLSDYRSTTGVRNFIAAAIYNDALEQSRKKKMMANAIRCGGENDNCDSSTSSPIVVLVTKEDREREKLLIKKQQQQQNSANNASATASTSSSATNSGGAVGMPSSSSSNTKTASAANDTMVTMKVGGADPFMVGPVNSTIGPRALIPPTTITCNIFELQQAALQYQQQPKGGAGALAGGGQSTTMRKSALPPPHLRNKRMTMSSSATSSEVSTPTTTLPQPATLRKSANNNNNPSSSSFATFAAAAAGSNSTKVAIRRSTSVSSENRFMNSSSNNGTPTMRKQSFSSK